METQEGVSFLLNEDEQELIRMFREMSYTRKYTVYKKAMECIELEKEEAQQQKPLAPIINFQKVNVYESKRVNKVHRKRDNR